jgi:integrase
MMEINEQRVKAAECPAGRKDALFFDDVLPGFGLRVTQGGKRIFLMQYRVGSKVRRATLGTWGTELTVAKARRKAEVLRGEVRDRRDPVAERKASQAAVLAAEAEAKVAAARDTFTVDKLIDEWTKHHLAARSASYAKRVPAELRAVVKKWLKAPAASFDRSDAVRVLDDAKSNRGPIAANRLRAEARACWAWAVKRGALPDNPWEATPRPLARETARERILSDEELGALYKAAGGLTEPWGVLVRVLILTGQRRGEVAGMRWNELDLDTGTWSLPGSRTKNGQPHVVPLPTEAVALLRTVKRRKEAEVVFEGPRKTAMSGFGKVKARLDEALAKAMTEVKRTPSPWVLHDLRRTVATGLQRLGIRLEVTEAVLNHVSGSRSGIVGVYQRHGWDEEKKAALAAWAKHVKTETDRETVASNVVPIRLAPGKQRRGR